MTQTPLMTKKNQLRKNVLHSTEPTKIMLWSEETIKIS